MKLIYFDCFSGASGDMILGALVDTGLKLSDLKKELSKIPLKDYTISQQEVTRQGFRATKINIKTSSKTISLGQMKSLIQQSELTETIKNKITQLVERLGNAEAKIHGAKNINELHLDELGAEDTLIDIAGVIIGLDILGVEKIYSSPLPLFRGFVYTHHGCIPLPAPVTAELLTGFPVVWTDIGEEIVTPTGALLISSLAQPVTQMPVFSVSRIGYGAGSKDLLAQPNLLRAFLGETINQMRQETIWTLETNIDNTTPEIIGYLFDELFEAGALDVFIIPIQMKKSRPAWLLTVLVKSENVAKIEEIIYTQTSTLGIRKYPTERSVLERETQFIETPYGEVRVKIGRISHQIKSISPEYEDCYKIAKTQKIPLKQVYQLVMEQFGKESKNEA